MARWRRFRRYSRRAGMYLKKSGTYYVGAMAGYMGVGSGASLGGYNMSLLMMMLGTLPFNARGAIGQLKGLAQGYTFGMLASQFLGRR